MKKPIQVQEAKTDLLDAMTEKQQSKRRNLLKASGAVGGIAVAGVWSKPVLKSVMSPAHAEMSVAVEPEPEVEVEVEAIMMGGSTSSTSALGYNLKSDNNSIANKAISLLIPTVKAQSLSIDASCGVLLPEGDNDNTHCITLDFPAGDDVNGAINFNLTGPDVYYGFNNTLIDLSSVPYTSYYYYSGFLNLSGSGSATMTDRTFQLELNGLTIAGEVSEDFSSAAGEMLADDLVANQGDLRNLNDGGSSCGEQGYGAFWEVDLDSTSCTPGTGVADSSNIVIGELILTG